MFSLHQQDCVEFLRGLPAGELSLIVSDPAYESLEKHRKRGTTTRLKESKGSSNKWFPIFPNSRYREFFEACWHALGANTHLYIYCDKETMFVVKPVAEQIGFTFWNIITWDKVKIGMGYHYRSRAEYVLFFEKGKRKLHDLGMPNVFDFREDPEGYVLESARISGDDAYPTEKPVMVSEKLILQSSEPGELVCDPFMGSGSVGEAALKHGRRFVGCDVATAAHDKARPRLERVQACRDLRQLELIRTGAQEEV